MAEEEAVTAATIIAEDTAVAVSAGVALAVAAASEAEVLPEAADPAEGSSPAIVTMNIKTKEESPKIIRVLFFCFQGMMVVSDISMLLMMMAAVSSIERFETLMTMQPSLLYNS